MGQCQPVLFFPRELKPNKWKTLELSHQVMPWSNGSLFTSFHPTEFSRPLELTLCPLDRGKIDTLPHVSLSHPVFPPLRAADYSPRNVVGSEPQWQVFPPLCHQVSGRANSASGPAFLWVNSSPFYSNVIRVSPLLFPALLLFFGAGKSGNSHKLQLPAVLVLLEGCISC